MHSLAPRCRCSAARQPPARCVAVKALAALKVSAPPAKRASAAAGKKNGAKAATTATQKGALKKGAKPAATATPGAGPAPLAYQAASAAWAAGSAALLASPALLWQLLGAPAAGISNVTETSTQVFGAYLLLAAAASYRLAEASAAGRLPSLTYQRLNGLLALFAAGSAVPLLLGAAAGDLAAAPSGAAAAALALAASALYAPGLAAGAGAPVASLAPAAAAGTAAALKSTLRAGRGLLGAFYALNFWEDAVLGVALLFGPILPTVAGAVTGATVWAKDLVGVGTLLYGALVWALLDASDRGRLGAATFRALNAACGAVSVAVGAVCVAGQAGGISTNLTNQAVVLVSCGLTAGVFLWQAARPAEQGEE